MQRYKVSRRQAYRYLQEALKAGQIQPVPGRKVVFTVRLAESLVQQVREFAEKTGKSLSDLTAEALVAFLKRGGGRG
jgi:predicted HicB family RNase H-like nuclease